MNRSTNTTMRQFLQKMICELVRVESSPISPQVSLVPGFLVCRLLLAPSIPVLVKHKQLVIYDWYKQGCWLKSLEFLGYCTATHWANFDEKVHKPQSKSKRLRLYKGTKMQHVSYEFEYFQQCIMTFWGLRDSKGPILMHQTHLIQN